MVGDGSVSFTVTEEEGKVTLSIHEDGAEEGFALDFSPEAARDLGDNLFTAGCRASLRAE